MNDPQQRFTRLVERLGRLNYVHQNPVRHGLVPVANQYSWCSAAWFEQTATRAQISTIYSFRTDKIRVVDDFEVLAAGCYARSCLPEVPGGWRT